MFKKIMKCDYVFDSPWWDDVSHNAKVRYTLLLQWSASVHYNPFVIGDARYGLRG